jgi:hypothetical protein
MIMDTKEVSVFTEQPLVADRINDVAPIDTSPAAMLALAVQQGTPVADLQALMDLKERWEAGEAKKAFVVAMARFKKNVPALPRSSDVAYKDVKFSFCPLDKMCAILDPALAACGLSYNWTQSQAEGLITVTCTLTHKLGHSESTSLTASADNSGGKNGIQGIGSTNSYLQRYTLRAITGTAEAGDDDGAGAGTPVETISEDQCLKIESLISDHGLNSVKFHAWLLQKVQVEFIDRIPASEFRAVIRQINATIEMHKS